MAPFVYINRMGEIRNVAIIAHVDHGKTTLVDALLRQSKTKLTKETEGKDLIMDNNDLEKERGITTDNVITSKGYMGASLKWNPIYGKITWLNKAIVPFDINFNFGFGMTQTDGDESVPTLHLGTSQVFAWSKSMAFRWDLIWNMYRGTAKNDDGTTTTLSQNDLYLGLGMSFYFPEAGYR